MTMEPTGTGPAKGAATPPAGEGSAASASGRSRGKAFVSEALLPILVVAVVLGSIRTAVADWNDVPTGSMKPTILEGDRVFVDRRAYGLRIPLVGRELVHWADPVPGDVVTLVSPADGRRLLKRVVAVGGDLVEMRDGRLALNGVEVDWTPFGGVAGAFPSGEARRFFQERLGGTVHAVALRPDRPWGRDLPEIRIPDGKLLVLGDNRDESFDSRGFGLVDRGAVLGRVRFVALSVDPSDHWRPRWGRFGLPVR